MGNSATSGAAAPSASAPAAKKSSVAARLSKRASRKLAAAAKAAGVKGSAQGVDMAAVRADLLAMMDSDSYDDGSYAPVFIRLAWHSSGTFDASDGSGGSRGATMRFAPEKDDPENAGLAAAQKLLDPIKAKYPGLSHADLWVLAAYAALEHTGGPVIAMDAPMRTDGTAGDAVQPGRLPEAEHGLGEGLDEAGRIMGWENLAQHMRDVFGRMGFSDREMVALICGGHVYGRCHPEHSGYAGAWVEEPTKFSNEYAADLIDDEWMYVEHDTKVEGVPIPEETRPAPGKRQYMTAWAPSMEADELAEVEAAEAAAFPPGRYRVTDDWINVRRTHSPDSETIDQPKEGAEFNVVAVREFGKGVRGQFDVGGWASIVSSSGEPLMERIGDLDIPAGRFRVVTGAASRALLLPSLGDSDEAGTPLGVAAVDISSVEADATGALFGRVQADGLDGWVRLVDDKVGALLERIEPGYNDDPRRALNNGGILQVKYQMMLPSDMVLAWDPEMRKHVQEYAEDEDLLKKEFGEAFARLTTLGVAACPGMKSALGQ